jgi:hypothetical protein
MASKTVIFQSLLSTISKPSRLAAPCATKGPRTEGSAPFEEFPFGAGRDKGPVPILSVPLWGKKATFGAADLGLLNPRYCYKSRKLQGSRFFAKTLSSERSLIRTASIALPKSPMNFA